MLARIGGVLLYFGLFSPLRRTRDNGAGGATKMGVLRHHRMLVLGFIFSWLCLPLLLAKIAPLSLLRNTSHDAQCLS